MNNRDPFNLHRQSPAFTALRSSAIFSTQRTTPEVQSRASSSQEVLEAGHGSEAHKTQTTPPKMALPNQSGPTQRHPDLWSSSGQSRFATHEEANGGMSDKLSGMFRGDRKDSLPMYKDKPYSYSGSRKRTPWFRQKKVFAVLLSALAGLSWWFGILSPISLMTSGQGNTKPKSKTSWFGGLESTINWDERADKVREAFKTSFAGYENHAWGADEYHPQAKTSRVMTPKGMGWIIIDALDTMMIMNLTSELSHARQWIHTNLTYDQDHDVNTFETTIRMLGGLLSAHYLSTAFPGVYAPVDDGLSDDMYVEKATDLADRLLGAFGTESGIPLASVNLHSTRGIPSHADGGASSTAEATSVQLEMKYLSKLTGEQHYWEKAEKVMQVVDDNNPVDGLVPIFLYAHNGEFRGSNIRLGSRGDSYYEYLIKQYLQTSEQEPVYQAMWNESLAGVKKHLLTYSSPSNFTVLAERPNGLHQGLSPKMDHLVCFMPGTIALAATGGLPVDQARRSATWGAQQEEDMRLAGELMKTCWGMYAVTPTGLAGEITYFHLHDPPLMYTDFAPKDLPKSPTSFELSTQLSVLGASPVGSDDYIIKSTDAHNLQRPETVESLFYMWRITGDEKYREWGWKIFEAFMEHTAVADGDGFSSIGNVMTVPPPLRDNMESFWLAETLKYFYLLFSSNDILPLKDVVFNTEAHPFPRFQLGKLFKTGWERKSRGTADEAESNSKKDVGSKTATSEMRMQTVKGTRLVTATASESSVAATATDEKSFGGATSTFIS